MIHSILGPRFYKTLNQNCAFHRNIQYHHANILLYINIFFKHKKKRKQQQKSYKKIHFQEGDAPTRSKINLL